MKNLIPQFVQEKLKTGETHGNFKAFAMFVDLSGFTQLTQQLSRKGAEGAEELSSILNRIFAPLVELVYARGGFIPYFAGDSFTAIFPSKQQGADSVLETAWQARELFKVSQFGAFKIGVKVGIGYGGVEWGIIGAGAKAFYFRGKAIKRAAKSQVHAQQQEIVFHEAFKKRLGLTFGCRQRGKKFYLLEIAEFKDINPPISIPRISISKSIARKFLPDAVIDFNHAGEFRQVVSVFISFEGVKTHRQLEQFTAIVLERIRNFSGYFKEIDFGDKGGVLACLFGAPVTFENNVERALEFISSVQEKLEEKRFQRIDYRAGITAGLSYTGIIGGKERCQYAAVGNRVNLAARLMMEAEWGEILADEEVQKLAQFKFKKRGNIKYKGIEGDVPTFELQGRDTQNKFTFSGEIIGREEELRTLKRFAKQTLRLKGAGIAYIYGEAGIGKSRLAYEVRKELRKRQAISWFVCKADQILRKGLNPFVYFLKNYFEQSPDQTTLENQESFDRRFKLLISDCAKLEQAEAAEICKELKRTRSVFAGLLGLPQNNTLWTQLDAKGRFQNIITALSSLFIAESMFQAVVIYLEDGHWFDETSKTFLQEFARRIQQYPIFLLVTSRYHDDSSKGRIIPDELLSEYNIKQIEVDLNFLSHRAIRLFAANKLGGLITDDFHQLLIRATNGNPFYLEQVLEYFRESDLLVQHEGEWQILDKNVKLSSSINAILTARIDRLSSLVKETVKAAAVIGQEFDLLILSEVMQKQSEFVERNENPTLVLKEQVRQAERGQIWQAMNELRYIFRHSLLREAVYDMQLRTRLRNLHELIAEAIEKLYADSIEERYADLAFHYEQAEIEDKTDLYLKKAADHARRNYQNKLALAYYEKMIVRINDQHQRANVLLEQGRVLELIGRWEKASKTYEEALNIARDLNHKHLLGRTNVAFGNLLLLQGNYEDARLHLEIGASFFEFIEDVEGMSQSYGSLGNLYFRQGEYADAKSFFIQSISLAEHTPNLQPDPQIVANLGLTYMNQGDYDAGIQCQADQIEISEQQGDKQGLANLYTSLGIVYFEKGDFEASLGCHQKGLAFSEELGDKQITAIAIGCIGRVYERQGNYAKAMENYWRDLEICKELGDKQGTAIVMGLLGDLYTMQGEFDKAIEYIEQGLELCRELGYQKGIAKAINTLGDLYFYKDNYEASLEHYDQAIEVTRKIDNKLVLGFSLVEKSRTLLAANRLEEIEALQSEAVQLAAELGNPDLIFEATILTSKYLYHRGLEKDGIELLYQLLSKSLGYDQLAAVYYHLSQMQPEKAEYRQRALEIYENLYESTPHYTFKMRIEALRP